MKALVLGAAGFAGQHLVEHLRECGDEVYSAGLRQRGVASKHEIQLDITDAHGVREVVHKLRPQVVYHLAGIAFVPEAESDFSRVLQINVGGTANVTRACHLLNTGISVLFVSSAEVYGVIQPGELPITEDTPLRPANNYSLSKRMAELVVERYARTGSIIGSVVRPFNHIGPGQDSRFVASSFALQLAKIAHGQIAPVLQVGNLEARRDFSDVRDIVRSYRNIALSGGGVFNVGSGRSRAVRELLDILISVSGVAVDVQTDPDRMRGPEVPELYGSYERARSVCGWQPSIPLERSLEDVYRYWYDLIASGVAVP